MTTDEVINYIDSSVETFINKIVNTSDTIKEQFFSRFDGSGTAELGYCCWGDISYKYHPENATSFNVENGVFALSDSTTIEDSVIIDSPHFVVKLGELIQPVTSPLSFLSNYSDGSFRYSYFTGNYSYTNSSGATVISSPSFLLSSDGGNTFSHDDSRLRYTSQQSYASTITYNYSFPYNSQWFWVGTQFYSSSFTPNAINLNLPSAVSYNILTDKLIDHYNTLLDPSEEPVTSDDIQPYSHYVPTTTTTTPPPVSIQTVPAPPFEDISNNISIPSVSVPPLNFFVESANFIYDNVLTLPFLAPFSFAIIFTFIIRKLMS